jgi:predicted DNA-binding protein (MmcQ/YjbR family)
MARTKDAGGSAVEQLRQFGLRYPGAHTKSPWPGHLDLAVNDKTFAYLSLAGEPLSISCKLPQSAEAALALPFTTPSAYGLGKSGWVTATFPDDTPVPIELLQEWIDESYRAQAPKRLSAGLPPPRGADASVEADGPDAEPPPSGRRRAARPARSTVKRARSATAARATSGAATKRKTVPVRSKRAAPSAKKRSSVNQRATQRAQKKR